MPRFLLHPSLDSDQLDQFFFMLHCLSRGVPFSHSSPLPTDVFQCEGHLFVFPLLWGLMDGLCCCTSHKGEGGGVGSVYWLAAKSESPWILQAPSLRLVMQLLTKLFSKLDNY